MINTDSEFVLNITNPTRPPDKCVLENYFLYFSSKTYGVGTQKNRLIEMGKEIITILPS